MTVPQKGTLVLGFLLLGLGPRSPVHAVNRLFINPQTVAVGNTGVTVPIRLNNDQNLYGFSLSLSTDATRLELLDINLTGTTSAGAEWSFGQALENGARISWGVVMDISDPFDLTKVVPVGQNLIVANLRLDVTAIQMAQAVIDFQDFPANYQANPPDPGARNKLLREQGVSVEFESGAGVIQIVPSPGVGPFLRGDCNGDGAVSGTVTDAVFMLNFNFLGGPDPPCAAACDVNSDGAFSGTVTDAIFLLNFNFLGGPQPAAPYPLCDPGDSPEDIALGCVRPRPCN